MPDVQELIGRARKSVEKAVSLDPTRGIHWLCLGKSCLSLGDLQRSETYFRRVAETFEADSSDNHLFNLACLASIQGDIDQAYACFKDFLLHHPCALAWAEKDDDLVQLRADQRFAALRSQHHAPASTA